MYINCIFLIYILLKIFFNISLIFLNLLFITIDNTLFAILNKNKKNIYTFKFIGIQ